MSPDGQPAYQKHAPKINKREMALLAYDRRVRVMAF